MNKNILFIGGAGFIGSNLIKPFIKNNEYNIFVYEPLFANISQIENDKKNITLIRGTLADYNLLSAIIIDHDIQTVVHLVSTLIPGSSYDDYKREFENVIFPSVRLMELCAKRNVKFVYFSSGGTIYGNNSNEEFKEPDRPAPISYYGLSKQILEDSILFENRRGNLCYLIIRPSNPFGFGQSLNGSQGFIAVSIGKILANEPIIVWGDGSSVRDYIYIDDLADSFFQLINNNIENETINIGSGFGYSINEIIAQLKKIAGDVFKVKYESSRSVDVSRMILDITKLKTYINVKHTPLEEGMQVFFNCIKTILKK